MIIGLTGPPCAGKATVAAWLAATSAAVPVATVRELLSPDRAGLLGSAWRPDVHVVVPSVELGGGADLAALAKRPYFLLVRVDAPALVRYGRRRRRPWGPRHRRQRRQPRRRRRRQWRQGGRRGADQAPQRPPPADPTRAHPHPDCPHSLHAFIRADDRWRSPPPPPPPFPRRPPPPPRPRPAVTIPNAHAGLPPLHAALRAADLLSPAHRRPPWDAYFMALARLAAARTNCMRRRVGAVVTVDRRIVATGYNGTPVGATNCADGGCERCNDVGAFRRGVGLELCVCLHAEENAIIEAGRLRCGGGVMYTTVFPCMACAKKIAQAGVVRVVYGEPYATDGQAARFLGGVGVELVARPGSLGGAVGRNRTHRLAAHAGTAWGPAPRRASVRGSGGRRRRGALVVGRARR
ncbi:hypothetical protein BU14_0524s0007 [Porphyra umbilicalis]|uniref:dCMP deaminase n=1 Tax=Porphyra umbilicalis TaxID=2786 RepID=A0A1X6NSH3_PORUM|nr:hypothetical protein BU14_0524s0007 [Porphyra umbilicalis]|eukprot:OSX71525.1 hypothetical protein BU14_0524s0007 [Porphyra umbilicalis]